MIGYLTETCNEMLGFLEAKTTSRHLLIFAVIINSSSSSVSIIIINRLLL